MYYVYTYVRYGFADRIIRQVSVFCECLISYTIVLIVESYFIQLQTTQHMYKNYKS